MEPNGSAWIPALVATGVATVVGYIGSRATELGPWYRELRKPSWQPPDWAFGAVWTTVYAFSIWSVAKAWPMAAPEQRTSYLLAWGVNVLLNMWWSLLFFRQRRPDLALVEVVALWLSIVVIIVFSWQITPAAGLLLLPYLVWVSIATVLNRAIVRLNAPFSPS
jgi:tryptophan-rich sensory protein